MNKKPMQFCIDLLKSLDDQNLKIYKEFMDEDSNSVPNSYLVIKTHVSDSPKFFGDGINLKREAICDLSLVSPGISKKSTSTHNSNIARIETKLKSANISYTTYNLGYNKATKTLEHTFSFKVIYE